MTPTTFPQVNRIYAKDQPEYLPLPACVTLEGVVISCWELTPEELAEIQKTGVLWVQQLTFGQSLQPLLPQVENPFDVPGSASAGNCSTTGPVPPL